MRRNITHRMNAFSQVIKAAAADIVDHHEKQRFLKVLYENFYKAHSSAKADRLGIVYTLAEIVCFMVASAGHLVHEHFGRFLQNSDVELGKKSLPHRPSSTWVVGLFLSLNRS